MGGVQGALTLFCGGVAQTFHDDRVVELKEQLVVEEVDGEGQEGKIKEEGRGRVKENAPWMTWRWQCDWSELEPMRCAVSSRVWINALYVHAQRTCVHHAIVEVNIVIGVVLGELHVVVRVVPLVVCDDAEVRRTLVLIALVVIVVFVVAI